jgi:hypothetical protein
LVQLQKQRKFTSTESFQRLTAHATQSRYPPSSTTSSRTSAATLSSKKNSTPN